MWVPKTEEELDAIMRQAELEESVQLLQRTLDEGMTPELRAEIDEFLEVPRECGVVRPATAVQTGAPGRNLWL